MVAVIVKAVADAVDLERLPFAELAVAGLGADRVHLHEQTQVAALRRFGVERA